MRFIFEVLPEDGSQETIERISASEAGAKSIGGVLAKKRQAPVDILRSGDEPYNERYLTTAMPSEHHACGFRYERLEN